MYEISDPDEGSHPDDPFCRLESHNSGRLPDWDLIGYSYDVKREKQVTGIESIDFIFKMLVARKTGCVRRRLIVD